MESMPPGGDARNTRKWRKLGHNGAITKWQAGVVVEGELVARREGQFGELLDLRTDEGKDITVPVTAGLRSRLKKIEPGAYVKIECTGKALTKAGKECWDFEAAVAEEEAAEEEAEDLPFGRK